jgi:hypothetical protein
VNGKRAGVRPEETVAQSNQNQRTPPNLQICRAKPAGFGDYVDCLVARPGRCLFALAFGEGYLCRHPARHDIVARTHDPSPPEKL